MQLPPNCRFCTYVAVLPKEPSKAPPTFAACSTYVRNLPMGIEPSQPARTDTPAPDRRNRFGYEDLLACGRGELFPDGPQLPLPPMLMFDRISEIAETGGEHGKGMIRAELDVKADLWFFLCHFKGEGRTR